MAIYQRIVVAGALILAAPLTFMSVQALAQTSGTDVEVLGQYGEWRLSKDGCQLRRDIEAESVIYALPSDGAGLATLMVTSPKLFPHVETPFKEVVLRGQRYNPYDQVYVDAPAKKAALRDPETIIPLSFYKASRKKNAGTGKMSFTFQSVRAEDDIFTPEEVSITAKGSEIYRVSLNFGYALDDLYDCAGL